MILHLELWEWKSEFCLYHEIMTFLLRIVRKGGIVRNVISSHSYFFTELQEKLFWPKQNCEIKLRIARNISWNYYYWLFFFWNCEKIIQNWEMSAQDSSNSEFISCNSDFFLVRYKRRIARKKIVLVNIKSELQEKSKNCEIETRNCEKVKMQSLSNVWSLLGSLKY